MKPRLQHFIHRVFYDKEGRVVIVQRPNTPLTSFFVSSALAMIIHQPELHQTLTLVAHVCIIVFAVAELATGLSLFRRILGAVVLLASIGASMWLHLLK